MKTFVKLAAFAVSTTLISSGAMAATATNDMTVSATVTRTCTVSAGALTFAMSGSAAATAQSAVSVTCTAGSTTDATVSFSNGANQTVTTSPRNLIGGDGAGGKLIPYTLSATALGANIAPGASVGLTKGTDGTSYSATFYGSIAEGAKQIGTYGDTVAVTVTYQQ